MILFVLYAGFSGFAFGTLSEDFPADPFWFRVFAALILPFVFLYELVMKVIKS